MDVTVVDTPQAGRFEGRLGDGTDSARERVLRLVALCPYVRAYLRRHDEYADLVDRPRPGRRATDDVTNDGRGIDGR